MSKSLETAQKIMDHLEGREAPNRGVSGAIGRLQRREYNDTLKELANLIDGKAAVDEKPAEDPKAAASGTGGGADASGKATGGKAGKA